MNETLGILTEYLLWGAKYGLPAGLLVGGITWVIINNPEYLFRALFGLALGGVAAGLIYAPDMVRNANLLRAAAGSTMPHNVVQNMIDLTLKIFTGGMVGMLGALGVSAPRDAIIGALIGIIAGTLFGALLYFTLQSTGLALNPLFYPLIIGLLTLVSYAILGSA